MAIPRYICMSFGKLFFMAILLSFLKLKLNPTKQYGLVRKIISRKNCLLVYLKSNRKTELSYSTINFK